MPRAGIVERRPVDRRHESPGISPSLANCAVAARVDAVAALLAARKHGLRSQDLRDRWGDSLRELANPVAEHRRRRRAGRRHLCAPAIGVLRNCFGSSSASSFAAAIEDHAVRS
jgi:hypothetical protein